MSETKFYEIEGAQDGLTEHARELFWGVYEDAAREVAKNAPEADMKRPGLLLEGLRRYLRREPEFYDASIGEAVAYFCGAARAEGLSEEAYMVELYAKAYLRKTSNGGGGAAGGSARGRGHGRKQKQQESETR